MESVASEQRKVYEWLQTVLGKLDLGANMGAALRWLFQQDMKGAGVNEAVTAIQADLRDNAAGFLRALAALTAYRGVSPLIMENAHKFIAEILRQVGAESLGEIVPPASGKSVSYAGLEPREAAAVDLAMYGESRTLEDIQSHVFGLGFERTREGQIRSSINARGNRDVFFHVGPDDKVSLTSKGKRLAQEVRERLGLQ